MVTSNKLYDQAQNLSYSLVLFDYTVGHMYLPTYRYCDSLKKEYFLYVDSLLHYFKSNLCSSLLLFKLFLEICSCFCFEVALLFLGSSSCDE